MDAHVKNSNSNSTTNNYDMIAKLSAILPFILVASAAPSNIKRADNQQIHINGDGSKVGTPPTRLMTVSLR